MSTPEELAAEFKYDPEDDTFSLEVWFARQDEEDLVRFCAQHQIDPSALIHIGIVCVIEATEAVTVQPS